MDNTYNIAIVAALQAGAKIMEVYTSGDFDVREKQDHSPLTLADRSAHEVIVSYLRGTEFPVLSEEGRDIPYAERSKWDTFWLVDPLDGTKEFIKKNGEFTVNIALIKGGKAIFGVVYAPVLEDLYVGISGQGAWLKHQPGSDADMNIIRATAVKLPDKSIKHNGIPYRVVASRSHLNSDTEKYLTSLRKIKGEIEIVSIGSSLKLCMLASGHADEYPRLGPTMEWDVAAAHALVSAAGKNVYQIAEISVEKNAVQSTELTSGWKTAGELEYNKENLLNPYFLVI